MRHSSNCVNSVGAKRPYFETSAKTEDPRRCAELKQAIIDGIQWENIPGRSAPDPQRRG